MTVIHLRETPRALLERWLANIDNIDELLIIGKKPGHHKWEIASKSGRYDGFSWLGLLSHVAHDIEHRCDIEEDK